MRILRSTLSGPILLSLVLIVLAFVLAVAAYDRLPYLVPTHWNASGVTDGRMAKPWGPFVLPLTMAGVFMLLLALPHISPRNYDMEPFRRTYAVIQLGIVGFLFTMNAFTLAVGLGWPVSMKRLLAVAMGALLMFVGNFMGKLTPNFFVGIRTPWTLANREVWLRTHRFAGPVLLLTGLAIVVAGLVGVSMWLLTSAVIVSAIVPAIYSYFIYLKLERASPSPPTQNRS